MVAKFKYRAVDLDGLDTHGSLKSDSLQKARADLRSRDLNVSELRELPPFLSLQLSRQKVSRKDLMHFSRQLSAFVRAGVPILESLETIAEETSSKTLRAAQYEMAEELKEGSTFVGTVANHPRVFPPVFIGMLRAAELTGNLDVTLDHLATYIDRDLEARRKVTSALVYPGLVMAMSAITVVVLTVFVLPKFQTFFASLHATLPLPTRMLIGIANFLTGWWPLFVVLLIIFIMAGVWSRKTTTGRGYFDRLILHLPAVSGVVRFAILERFCRVLSSMVTAGVSLPEAMQVTSGATNNLVYRLGLETAQEGLLRGEGLYRPLADTGLFPTAARQIFKVGEETGTLDEQLETAANYFDRELDYRIKNFTNLFEPAVIMFMGLIVGFVAIALVSAMYGIFRQVSV